MVSYERTEKGYCYKIDKNGKKQRISNSEYSKKTGGNINSRDIAMAAQNFHSRMDKSMKNNKANNFDEYIRKQKKLEIAARQKYFMLNNKDIVNNLYNM